MRFTHRPALTVLSEQILQLIVIVVLIVLEMLVMTVRTAIVIRAPYTL